MHSQPYHFSWYVSTLSFLCDIRVCILATFACLCTSLVWMKPRFGPPHLAPLPARPQELPAHMVIEQSIQVLLTAFLMIVHTAVLA